MHPININSNSQEFKKTLRKYYPQYDEMGCEMLSAFIQMIAQDKVQVKPSLNGNISRYKDMLLDAHMFIYEYRKQFSKPVDKKITCVLT